MSNNRRTGTLARHSKEKTKIEYLVEACRSMSETDKETPK